MTTTIKFITTLTVCLLLAFSMTSCNNAPRNAGHDHATHESHDAPANATHVLALNNGQKWNADESTNAQVDKMQAAVAEFRHQNTADYRSLAGSLQRELNALVAGCKMTGADHDALHLWLKPLMRDVKELNSTDPATAEKAYGTLQQRLTDYDTFFE